MLLLVNSAYLWAFASPSIFYMANVLAHILLGVALAAATAWVLMRRPDWRREARLAAVLLGAAAAFGLYLTWTGALRPNRWALWAHIALAVAGMAALVCYARAKALACGGVWVHFARALQGAAILLVALPAVTHTKERLWPNPPREIRNPLIVPTSMEEEGLGPKSPLWPSAAKTTTGELIPSDFFLDSKVCGECHKDIYEQWLSSAHRFSSFNNQFYRKSIEYMQSIVGTKPSRWCAGCHDHAMFFNGRFDVPAVKQLDTPEAHAGLACVSCHSIVHVDGTMGNGGFTIMYP
ncbi:MAG TPA: multiheme c-type cytochrome, partial [Bryobacteraceae bacterium]|nr:multiheme c-type cytochrome [Bryobacteraceae bacterium]